MKHFARNLALATAATFGSALLSQLATGPGSSVRKTYDELDKPAWAPPPWLFGPVWTALYTLLSGATAIVASSEDPRARRAVRIYAAQLVANGLWTPLFFRARRYDLAEADVVAVTALLALVTANYARINGVAGLMAAPSVLWCLFATALTHDIRSRNAAR